MRHTRAYIVCSTQRTTYAEVDCVVWNYIMSV